MAWVIKRTSGVKAVLLGAAAVAATAMPSGAAAQAAPDTCDAATNLMTNGGFELPDSGTGTPPTVQQVNENSVPGWSTSEGSNLIEIWESGFSANPRAGVPVTPSHTGDQFAEINAQSSGGTLSQIVNVNPNAEVVLTWAHRGRPNNSTGATLSQTASLALTDNSGASVNSGAFSADSTAWIEHSQTLATGNTATQLTVAFTSLTAGSSSAQGNFLDSITACQTFLTFAAEETTRNDVDGSGGDSAGDIATIQYTISNPSGNARGLDDVTVTDPLLGTFTIASPTSGDTDGDGILDPGETWIVTRPYTLTQQDLDDAADTPGFELTPTANSTGDTGDNVLNSNPASYTVPITTVDLVAVNDSTIAEPGENNVLNVLTGDTFDGNAATTTNASLSVATGSAVPPQLTFNPATGNVSVVAGTPPGPYSFDYEICEQANPPNCEIATATVTVASAPQLEMTKVADDDEAVTVGQLVTYTYTITNRGNVNVLGVTVGDVHNGSGPAPTPASETLTADNNAVGDSTDADANNGIWDVLAPGDVVTFTGTYTVTQADIDNLQ